VFCVIHSVFAASGGFQSVVELLARDRGAWGGVESDVESSVGAATRSSFVRTAQNTLVYLERVCVAYSTACTRFPTHFASCRGTAS
jgi:hypothetical protein